MSFFRTLYDWTLQEDYRTWIAHYVITLLIGMIGVPFAALAVAYYAIREVIQVLDYDGVWRLDNVMDAVAPLLAFLTVVAIR